MELLELVSLAWTFINYDLQPAWCLDTKKKKDSNSHLARKSVRCSVTDRKIHLSGKRNNSFVVVVDGEGMANYNEQFVEAWKQTTNYQVWRGKEHAGIDDVHAG